MYERDNLNTTMVVVLQGFHNYGFLKQVYVTNEYMLEMVSNNAKKSG